MKAIVQVLSAALLALSSAWALAQGAYPNRPIRLIVPYPPGGSTTAASQLLAPRLAKSMGQQVIVDNRPGGNTVIGSQATARAPADGYTVLLVTSTHAINPLMMRDLPYDSIRDFTPIGTVLNTYYLLAIHPGVPAQTLAEFIALARKSPKSINYGSVGSGGAVHLASELFNSVAGVDTQQVPYKGTGPLVTDLMAGRVQFFINNTLNLAPMVKVGKLRGLAVSGEQRSGVLPEVPTFAEAGLPGYKAGNWFGLLGPAGLPRDILARLSGELMKIIGSPEVREELNRQGLDPFASTPDQFAALIKSDMARFATLVESAGIKMEN